LSKIAQSHGQSDVSKFAGVANFLIKKDRRRNGKAFGQNISGTFHLADFFMRTDDCIEKDARRLLRILFGAPDVTPTKNEFIMFEAKANAYRSGDLSRQVGAVITNSKMEIVSQGCNEVPIPGGILTGQTMRRPCRTLGIIMRERIITQ
jgi:cytidine deaminase